MNDQVEAATFQQPDGSVYWRRNLVICLIGSFTTTAARSSDPS